MGEELGSLKLLLAVQLAERLGSGVVSPILFLFMRGRGLTVSELGLIGTAGMLGWLIFEPLMGVVADRIRKKYLLVFSALASSFIYAAYPLAGDFWHFSLLAFAMSSVMSAYAVAVKALAAELIPPAGRGRTYGRYVSAISIGGIIGPFLGGYLTEAYARSVPFYMSAGVGVVGMAAALLMRYDERKTRERPAEKAAGGGGGSLWTRPFIAILAIRMLYMFNLVFRQGILPVFLHESPRFGASETQIGLYLGLMQLTSAVSQALLGDVSDRVGSRRIMASSLFLSGISYMGMLGISGAAPLLILGALQGVIFAAADLSMMIHLMNIMPKDRTGMVMGLYSESENVGGMAAAPSLGFTYDAMGPASSVASVSAILILSGFLSALLIRDGKEA